MAGGAPAAGRCDRSGPRAGGGGEHFEAWGELEAAIRTGRSTFEIRHGAGWVDYYRAHPDAGRAFGEAMSATTRAFEDAILDADPVPRLQPCRRRRREAARAGGGLAIVETVLPDAPDDHPGWLMDLNTLAITGGRERNEPEFGALLKRAGWEHERSVPTASPLSVILACAARPT
jgi:O-methyltransferase domain